MSELKKIIDIDINTGKMKFARDIIIEKSNTAMKMYRESNNKDYLDMYNEYQRQLIQINDKLKELGNESNLLNKSGCYKSKRDIIGDILKHIDALKVTIKNPKTSAAEKHFSTITINILNKIIGN